MNPFLKIVDIEGDMIYINSRWVISVRPGNRKSFRESGAEIKVNDGIDTKTYFTAPGAVTDSVVSWLGIEGH